MFGWRALPRVERHGLESAETIVLVENTRDGVTASVRLQNDRLSGTVVLQFWRFAKQPFELLEGSVGFAGPFPLGLGLFKEVRDRR